ncbi:hypothetical protein INS49_004067 [Diaporthe citri]|uniref:uncharacterized protein n=1 Tax=Diaporthe citri TaxID=83186 RepID=UPI001C80D892|nr:uncharacterized protein INS49_004067 [Diaporthe citri]KAG6354986.1 hypothetical protein INS49_004067 [Diaporthe citri]
MAIDEVSEKVKEIDRLRATAKKQQGPPRAQIVHRVECHKWRSDHKYFLDEPWVVESGPFDAHLRGSQPINNFELYLERNKEIALIVYKDYQCCDKPVKNPPRNQGDIGLGIDASFLLKGEEISLIAPELREALAWIADVALEGIPHPDFNEANNDGEDDEILYPYIWYFHRRVEIHDEIDKLPQATRVYVDCFRDYVESRMEEEWQSVKSLMGEGKISAQYMKYLIVPGQIIISQGNNSALSQRTASVAEDWLHVRQSPDSFSASVSTYTWAFDGNFSKTHKDIDIYDIPSLEEPFNILDLRLYPMEFASEDEIEALRKRGHMFWRCRTRNYVSLHTESEDGMQNPMSARFMVDIATHKQMHRGDKLDRARATPEEDELEAEYMLQDDPDLGDEFFMCLPTSIPGFNMQKKEWEETKLLIQAVVTNRVRASENTDLITGKGNGLFILLHGGPGTGKTLTAESVAEIARRPLYRVTCGDIGTKAEDVENYLEAVLLLGKKWDCVVLLDEADVFLEQRSVSNLERNALVTVFEGILILTSNRVGILDEAFKSRIQLNLRYKTLEWDQRLQIWKNFLERLQRLEQEKLRDVGHVYPGPDIGYGIKFKEISNEIEVLAKAELNGRQIRNAISTARELATYQREPMGYEHLKTVIKEAEKFDEYLLELNEYYTADQIQRDKKER